MKENKAKKSVIYKWMLSYVFIFAIPMIVLTGSIMSFLSIYEDEVKYADSLVLNQERIRVDQSLLEAKSWVAEISIDPMIRKLLAGDPETQVLPYEFYKVNKFLNQLLLSRNENFDVMIYFPSYDKVCSNYSYSNLEDYYDIYLEKTGLSKKEWEAIATTKYDLPYYFSYKHISANGDSSDRIVMISPSMIEKHSNMYANIILFFDNKGFVRADNEQLLRETFLIIDEDKGILYESEDINFNTQDINYMTFSDEEGSSFLETEKGKFIASYIESEYADWKYVILTDEKSYMKQINGIKINMYLRVGACLIIGGLLIHFMLKKNYVPLHNLIQSIQDMAPKKDSKDKKMNEYQYITQTINQLQSEKKISENTILQQKESLRSQLLINMVENKNLTNEFDQQTLRRYNIDFQSENFLVLIFLVYDFDEPFEDASEPLDEKGRNQLVFMIFKNITEDKMKEKNIKPFFFHIGNLIGFILNPMDEDRERLFSDIEEQVQHIKKTVHNHFRIRFSTACSDVHQGINDISYAYSEALQVLEYKRMLNLGKVVYYPDMVKLAQNDSFIYPSEIETHIINNLKIGNKEKTLASIQKVIDLNFESKVNAESLRYLMVNIAGTIIKTVNKLEKKVNYSFAHLTFHSMLQENEVSVMLEEVNRNVGIVCDVICEKQSTGKKICNNTIYEKSIEIVDGQYMNSELSVGMIADKIGVHIVHLSRTFAEYSGESLSNYIHNTRIEHAKKLILEGYKLETVSDKVGYGSLRTFMRAFKKHEGITPGQYKAT